MTGGQPLLQRPGGAAHYRIFPPIADIRGVSFSTDAKGRPFVSGHPRPTARQKLGRPQRAPPQGRVTLDRSSDSDAQPGQVAAECRSALRRCSPCSPPCADQSASRGRARSGQRRGPSVHRVLDRGGGLRRLSGLHLVCRMSRPGARALLARLASCSRWESRVMITAPRVRFPPIAAGSADGSL
jgi:hypothetical protein